MQLRPLLAFALAASVVACSGDDSTLGPQAGGRDEDESPAKDTRAKDAGQRDARSTKPDTSERRSDDDETPFTGADEDDAQDEEDVPCDSVSIEAKPNAPEILIVLDRSGSMVGAGDIRNQGKNRWVPSVSAVKKLTTSLEQSVSFGLMLFPAPGSGGMGIDIPGLGTIPLGGGATCTVGKVEVPVALGNASKIGMSLDVSMPDLGATPTAGTLENAFNALSADSCADCGEVPKYVLLVTDGQPNCGAGGTMTTQADIDASLAALDKLRAAKINTYVIGYDMASDATSAAIMEQFAQHGGTEKYMPVENEADLTTELGRIAGSLVSCSYELNKDVEDPKLVRVIIDGEELMLGDGWTLDGRTISLDSACDKIRDAKIHNIKIRKDCPPQIVR